MPRKGRERGGRVGTAAAQPRLHRDVLGEVDSDAARLPRPSESGPQRERGARDEIAIVDRHGGVVARQRERPAARCHLERVVQRQRLKHRLERVEAIGSGSADAQRQVDLRMGTNADGAAICHGLLPPVGQRPRLPQFLQRQRLRIGGNHHVERAPVDGHVGFELRHLERQRRGWGAVCGLLTDRDGAGKPRGEGGIGHGPGRGAGTGAAVPGGDPPSGAVSREKRPDPASEVDRHPAARPALALPGRRDIGAEAPGDEREHVVARSGEARDRLEHAFNGRIPQHPAVARQPQRGPVGPRHQDEDRRAEWRGRLETQGASAFEPRQNAPTDAAAPRLAPHRDLRRQRTDAAAAG